MTKKLTRILIAVLAILLFSTGMLAGEIDQFVPGPQRLSPARSPATGGIELALVSILLGGAMVFLFRPKRQPVSD